MARITVKADSILSALREILKGKEQNMKNISKEKLVGVAGLVVCAILYASIHKYPLETKAFPIVAIILLTFLCVVLLFRRTSVDYKPVHITSVLLTFFLMTAYVVSLSYLGFTLATILFFVVFLFYHRHESRFKWLVPVYCVVMPILLYLVFGILCSVSLPKFGFF